uniref:Uncharacterized protein n=1 Tax=Anopheles culicifacies TaxID=139723 RepID=A0A182LSL0_9DIPT
MAIDRGGTHRVPVAILHTITAHIDPVPVNVARAGSKNLLRSIINTTIVSSTVRHEYGCRRLAARYGRGMQLHRRGLGRVEAGKDILEPDGLFSISLLYHGWLCPPWFRFAWCVWCGENGIRERLRGTAPREYGRRDAPEWFGFIIASGRTKSGTWWCLLHENTYDLKKKTKTALDCALVDRLMPHTKLYTNFAL